MITTASPHPSLPRRISLVSQTVDSLEAALQAGRWQGALPGERDLAALMQVSRHTLRNALAVLRQRGCIRTLHRRRQDIVSIPRGRGRPDCPRVIAAISERPLAAMSHASVVMVDQLRADLAKSGMELVIHTSAACFSAHPARALDALVTRTPAVAWLLFGSREPMQRWFIRRGLPCLVVGSCATGIDLPSVDVDYRAACRHAGALLIRRGHRSIGFLRTDGDFGGDNESERGLQEAVRTTPSVTLRIIRHHGDAGHVCARLDEALRSQHPPTAFVVARSVHVLTVVMHLMRRGKRIPQDVAVLARDDDAFLLHAVPSITRYASSQDQFARLVSRVARQLAGGGSRSLKSVRLMPRLIHGETV